MVLQALATQHRPTENMNWMTRVHRAHPESYTVQLVCAPTPRAPGGWGSYDFQTVGTWRWQGCQPCVPAALIYVTVDFMATVRSEGLSQWKVSKTPIGNRTRDLPACSAVLQPFALSPTLCCLFASLISIRWIKLECNKKVRLTALLYYRCHVTSFVSCFPEMQHEIILVTYRYN